MKFGEQLVKGKNPDWVNEYMDYFQLKTMILELEENLKNEGMDNLADRSTSLSVPRPTNAAGVPRQRTASNLSTVSQEKFFLALEKVISFIYIIFIFI